MVINLWLVGVTFNPKLIDDVETHDNVIVKIPFNKVIQKLILNHEDPIQVHLEFRASKIGSEKVFSHVVKAKWLNVDIDDDEMGEDVFPMDKEPNQICNDNMNTNLCPNNNTIASSMEGVQMAKGTTLVKLS